MRTRAVREHNTLNGLRFTVIEGMVMAVIVAGFVIDLLVPVAWGAP